MITREIFSDLMGFVPDPYLTTTLYLQIDGSPQNGHLIELKDLIKERKKELEKQELDPAVRKSVLGDLRKIQDFVTLKFSREGVRTLMLFSCSGKKWWKELSLTFPMKNRLIVNSRPHYRPISLVLDERRRFLTILVERAKARLFEVFSGDIVEHSSILDEVPAKVRVGGFGGYEERRIERHIEDHVRRHFRNVADSAYVLFKKHGCDSILLGGSEQNTHEFRHFLHNTLQERIAGTFHEEILASPKTVLEKTQRFEHDLRQREEQNLLNRFFSEVNSGGLGIVGMNSTLRALHLGQVNFLLVQEGFDEDGYRCNECAMLHTANGTCDACGATTQPVGNLVEETVEEALQQGCQVKMITLPENNLISAGRIGAMLRFKA